MPPLPARPSTHLAPLARLLSARRAAPRRWFAVLALPGVGLAEALEHLAAASSGAVEGGAPLDLARNLGFIHRRWWADGPEGRPAGPRRGPRPLLMLDLLDRAATEAHLAELGLWLARWTRQPRADLVLGLSPWAFDALGLDGAAQRQLQAQTGLAPPDLEVFALPPPDAPAPSQVEAMLFDGLSDRQRGALLGRWRPSLWTAPTGVSMPSAPDPVERCGLTSRQPDGSWRVWPPVAELLEERLPPPVRIHHISDVHFGGRTGWSEAVPPVPQPPSASGSPLKAFAERTLTDPAPATPREKDDRARPAELYLEHLEGTLPSLPHLVLFSGDLKWGPANRALDEGREWLQRVAARLPSPTGRPRLHIVGGNHDVVRPDAGYANRDERQQLFWTRVLTPLSGKAESEQIQAREPRRHAHDDLGVEVLLLESAMLAGEPNLAIHTLVADLKPVLEHLSAAGATPPLPPQVEKARDELAGLQKIVKDDFGTMDPGKVAPEVVEAIGQLQGADPIRIAVVHHPIAAIPGASPKEYPIITNSAALKRALFKAGVRLVLHGHEHQYHVAAERWASGEADAVSRSHPRQATDLLLQISAPTLASLDTYGGQGFVEIELLVERDASGELLLLEVEVRHLRLMRSDAGASPTFRFELEATDRFKVYEAPHTTRTRRLISSFFT